MNDDELDLFYIDFYKYKYILYIFVFIIMCLLYLEDYYSFNIAYLLNISTIVILLSALIFLNYCYTYNRNKIMKVLQIGILCILPLLFLNFMQEVNISFFGSYIDANTSLILDSQYFLDIYFLLLFLIMVFNKEDNYKKLFIVIGLVLLSILFLRFLYTMNYIEESGLVIFLYLVKIFICLLTIYSFKGTRFIRRNQLNIIMLNAISNIIFSTIDLGIYINSSLNAYNIVFIIIGLIRVFLLTVFTLGTCEKLLNTTYKVIFKEAIEMNNKLTSINNNLLVKKEHLEQSRKILSDAELLYKDFLRVIPIPLLILNSDNKRIIYANRSFLNLVDKDLRHIINNLIDDIIKIEYDDLRDLRLGINKIYRGFYRQADKDIKDLNIMPLSVNNTENNMILIIEDVTEKRKIEKIRKSVMQKELHEKIKKDFLSNISHDLKTPINVISSATQLNTVYAQSGNEDSVKEYLSISKESLCTLIQLTDNLMNLESESTMHLLPIIQEDDVVRFLSKKVNSLVKYAETKGINLKFISYDSRIMLSFDKEFLERIILNLISNSMKFTQVGGNIEVTVKQNEESVLIEIADNGRGMKQEFIETAFEKYSMQYELQDNTKDGSGIGLFVVYNLMRLQGGSVEVYSKQGIGTKFTLVFKRG